MRVVHQEHFPILRHQNYRRPHGRLKIRALVYARIIVSSILNLAAALTACGTFAGSVIVSPDLTR